MKKPIKVLQVFGSLNIGGAESRMMDIYSNINHEFVDFDFLTMQKGPQYFEEEIFKKNGLIYKISPPREDGIFEHIKKVFTVMKINGPYDVVHVHTSFHSGIVVAIAYFAGVPIRLTHARTTGSKNSGIKIKLSLFIGRLLILMFATEKLSISQDASIYLYGNRAFKNNKTLVLPNAIDIAKFTNIEHKIVSEMKQVYGIKDDEIVIGHVGRFEHIKNQQFLVEILKEYIAINHNVKLIFIGDGPTQSKVKELVSKYNLSKNVLFLGIREDVSVFMKIFNVLVMPSKFEGLCSVAVEAQASGTPCLLSDGIPSEVDMGLGLTNFLSISESIHKWISEIEKMIVIKQPQEIDIIKQFKKREYTIHQATKKLEDIYVREN